MLKKTILCAAAAATLAGGCCVLPKSETKYAPLSEFQRKLECGENATIAYFGGSITWGATATDPLKTSYRALLTESLQAKYPAAHIRAVDAAIGGKGSDLGVFRMDRDVLPYRPDLTLVEFAVNDSANAERLESMEGIVRKLLRSKPDMAVLIVITGAGKHEFISPRAADYTKLAEYYGLPSINICDAVRADIAAGKYGCADILTDGVHPNDRGYARYHQIIADALPKLAQTPGAPKAFPEKPLTANRYESARLVPFTAQDGWTLTVPSVTGAWFDHQPSRWLDAVLTPKSSDAVWETTLKCSGVGVYFESRPKGAEFTLQIDDAKPKVQKTAFGQQYAGLNHFFGFLDVAGNHKIRISVKGTNLALGYLLITE